MGLLQAIKELSFSYQDTKYDMKIVTGAIKNFVNLKQKDEESLIDYTTRFKTARDVMKAQLGADLTLHKVVMADPDYVKAETDEDVKNNKVITRKHYDRWQAYLYLENSDKNKYGSLINGLDSQQALGTNQYPTTLAKATEVLSNHRFDSAYMEQKKRKTRNNNNSESTNQTKSNEGQESAPTPQLSFANIEGKCYCCGKPGHKSPVCRMRDKTERKDWAINKVAKNENIHVQAKGQDEESTVSTTSQINHNSNVQEATSISTSANTQDSNNLWSSAQVGYQLSSLASSKTTMSSHGSTKIKNLKDIILLDNQSSEDLFGNKELLTNIHKSNTTLKMNTNGGVIDNDMKATLPNYGDVWYNPDAITNIISFAKMKDKGYKITYDSTKEDAFIVHTSKGTIKFNRNANNLYIMDPKEQQVYQLLETVEDNMDHYTPRQIERAKVARALYQSLGTPTTKDYKAIIRMNAIKNCPVTMEDIDIAEAIYGKDIGNIKGKTVRNRPTPVVKDYINIPKELMMKHEDITLCIDILYINEMPFLATISRNIKYRTIQWLPTRTAKDYRSALDIIFRQYNKAGFRIATIHCDNEFRPIMDDIKDELSIDMNYASAQEHVPEAERNNRVIKERVRAAFHRLPYNTIPKVMVKMLAMESTNKLNFFPPKGGVSSYYSPRMILTNSALDYQKHCSIPFGTYVQAHTETNPTNTMAARALDCIYLRPLYNQQGGHEVLDLSTKRVITRRKVTPIPITPSIITAVESIAQQEGMTGIKVRTHTGHTLYDSSWITGVDYDEDEDDMDYETDDEEENEEEEEQYDEVDQEEIAELLEEQENTNQKENTQTEEPVDIDPDEVLQQQDEEIVFTDEETDEETKEEAQETEQRRSGRERTQTT